jgi:hypothetical protein
VGLVLGLLTYILARALWLPDSRTSPFECFLICFCFLSHCNNAAVVLESTPTLQHSYASLTETRHSVLHM